MSTVVSKAWKRRVIAEFVFRSVGWHWSETSYGAAILEPTEWLARGLSLEPLPQGRLRAHAFVIPLFVPVTFFYLSHALGLQNPQMRNYFDVGERGSEGRLGEELATAFSETGFAWITTVGTLEGFLTKVTDDQAVAISRGREPITGSEEAGYAHLLSGELDPAVVQLTVAAQPLPSDAPTWDVSRRSRARLVLDLLEEDPGLATMQLESWATESAAFLEAKRHPRGA